MDKKVELMFKQDVSHIEEKINRKLSEKEKSELRKTYENPSVPNDASDALTYTVRFWYQNVENMQNFNILKMNRMKLPLIEDLIRKEKTMKKKIRDLTSEEYGKWELKNYSGIDCRDCPFKYVNCKCEMWVNHKDMYSNKSLDQEVDIPSPHILNKEEHDYLRAVCKPYKIKSITLIGDLSTGRLKVRLENNMNEWFELPVFKKGPMYKGMEVYKEYSIQDLELDKEWNND